MKVLRRPLSYLLTCSLVTPAFIPVAQAEFVTGPGPSNAVVVGSGSAAKSDFVIGPSLSPSSAYGSSYNGISGSANLSDILDEGMTLDTNAKLTAHLYNLTEKFEKACKPAHEQHPSSLMSLKDAAKVYLYAEKARQEILQARLNRLNELAVKITQSEDPAQTAQMLAFEFQIQSLNSTIDSIAGSTLFNLDGKGGRASKVARIPAREDLIVAVLESLKDNEQADEKMVNAYLQCDNGFKLSRVEAQKACERKKMVPCEEDEECTEKEVSDPVPGSCEMANQYIPLMLKGPMSDLVKLYGIKEIPSKEVNQRYIRITKFMDFTIQNFPRSDDPKYNWSTPLESCLEKPLAVAIKTNGTMCAAEHKNLDKSEWEDIGHSDDNLMMLGQYTLGVKLNTVEYEYAKRRYDELQGDSKNPVEGYAKLADWIIFESERGKAYLTDGTYDKVADRKLHEDLSREYKIPLQSCDPSICQGYKGPQLGIQSPAMADVNALSADTKSYLGALGLSGLNLAAGLNFFDDTWNASDLIIGQSNIRTAYFNSIQETLHELIKDDRAKLGELLKKRAALIEAFEKFKKLYSEKKEDAKLAGGSTPGQPAQAPSTPTPSRPEGGNGIGFGPGSAAPGSLTLDGMRADLSELGQNAIDLAQASSNRLSTSGSTSFGASSPLAIDHSVYVPSSGALGATRFDSARDAKIRSLASQIKEVNERKASKIKQSPLARGVKLARASGSASAAPRLFVSAPDAARGLMARSGFIETNGEKLGVPEVAAAGAAAKSGTKTVGSSRANAPVGSMGAYYSPTSSGGSAAARGASAYGTQPLSKDAVDAADALRGSRFSFERAEIQRNPSQYQGREDDSLFDKLSKAYMRNLGRID